MLWEVDKTTAEVGLLKSVDYLCLQTKTYLIMVEVHENWRIV
jgi:hypothetical protein